MLAWLLVLAASAGAAQEDADAGKQIEWQRGPLDARLGDEATLQVPEGYAFTDGDGTRAVLERWQNITDGSELGMVAPLHAVEGPAADASTESEAGSSAAPVWFACFEFKKAGKVRDDEELHPAKLLSDLQELQENGNNERARRGFEPLELVRWTTEPHYDAKTNNLEWGLLIRSPSGESVGYQVKLLGRYGYMSATLMCDPQHVEASLPAFRDLLAGYAFQPGNTYGEWKQGDPIAEYGITGLVLGGTAVAAWKFGILGKLLKFAKFIAVAVLAAIAGIWKWITGRRSRTAQ